MTIEAVSASGPPGSGAIAAGSRSATDAGASVLAQGGSAVDAALAAAFAAGICEPGLTSLGGGGFLMVREPTGRVELLDFFVAIPGQGAPAAVGFVLDDVLVRYAAAEQVFRIGPGSVAVPGCIDGFIEAHRRWGTLPLTDVVAPAIAMAEHGVALEGAQAHVLTLIEPVLAHTLGSRSLFTNDGAPLATGDHFALPPLANLLRRIGVGDITSFAHPDLLEALLAVCDEHSPMSAEDLQTYAVIEREPSVAELSTSTGLARLFTNAAPSFGGSIISTALTSLLARGGDPADLPREVLQATAVVKARGEQGREAVKGTTHVSAVDARGYIASMTTSAGSCAGVVLPGTGIQLNNMMGESDLQPGGAVREPAGARLRSMMAPSVLEGPDGGVVALGSGGSERIRSAMSSVLLHLMRGATLAEAVGAPRMHADDGGTLHVEPGADAALIDAAERALGDLADGTVVNHWSSHDFFFGGVNGIVRHPDGAVEAVADARRGGSAAVVRV